MDQEKIKELIHGMERLNEKSKENQNDLEKLIQEAKEIEKAFKSE